MGKGVHKQFSRNSVVAFADEFHFHSTSHTKPDPVRESRAHESCNNTIKKQQAMKIWKKKEKEKRLQVYDDVECRRDDDGMIGSETEEPRKNWIELLISNSDFLIVCPCAFPKRPTTLGRCCREPLDSFSIDRQKCRQPIRMSSKNEEIEFNVKTSSTSRSLPCISINISYRARPPAPTVRNESE